MPPPVHSTKPAAAADGYSGTNAMACSELAEAAYLPPDKFKKVAQRLGYTDVRFHTNGSSQAYVAVNGDKVVVAFRGTEPTKLADWVEDAKVLGKSTFGSETAGQPAGLVHRGFEEATQKVWSGPNGISAELKQLVAENPKRSILVTGHSLGGAMATLATAEMFKEKLPLKGTYVFGCPLVGDKSFGTWFEKNIPGYYPHQKQNDVVTRVPRILNWEPLGTKQLRYLTGDGNVIVGAGYFDKLSDRALGRLDSFVPKAEKMLDYGIDRGGLAARVAWHETKKVFTEVTGEKPHSEGMSFAQIWETDGIRDHDMDGYRKSVIVTNISSPTP